MGKDKNCMGPVTAVIPVLGYDQSVANVVELQE
jgi:hypothetical protein